MDREEARKLLRGGPEGVKEWNRRGEQGEEIPPLDEANLRGTDLSGADLIRADLRESNLREADLGDADLSGARLFGADLNGAVLSETDLSRADLKGIENWKEIENVTDTDRRDVKNAPPGFIDWAREGDAICDPPPGSDSEDEEQAPGNSAEDGGQ